MNALRGNAWLHAALIAAAVAAIYAGTLGYSFYFDDEWNLLTNPGIRHPSMIVDPAQGLKGGVIPVIVRPHETRTLSYLSFAASYAIGGYDPRQWRAVNIALHAGCALLVYALAVMLFRTPRLSGAALAADARPIALVSALLFAVHPLMTETVIYLSQRTNGLAAFFYLGSMAAYLKFRLSAYGRGRWALFALAFVSAACAMKSKEIAFTLPFMLLFMDVVFLDGPWRKRAAYLGPFALTLAIIPLSLWRLSLAVRKEMADVLRVETDTSRIDYIYTQFGVVAKYIRMIFLPYGLNADHDIAVQSSLAALPVLLPMLLIAALLAAGVWMLARLSKGRPEWALAGFGVLGFFAALTIESSVFPIVMIMNEYRTYLPMAVLMPGLVTMGAMGAAGLRLTGRRAAAAALIAVLAFGVAAHMRARVWSSGETFWKDVVSKSPNKVRAINNLATIYLTQRRDAEAMAVLTRGLALAPFFADLNSNMGFLMLRKGKPAEAAPYLKIAAMTKVDDPLIRKSLGIAYMDSKQYEKAAPELKIAAMLNPADFETPFMLGQAYYAMDKYPEARLALAEALKRNPANTEARGLLNMLDNMAAPRRR